MNSKIKALKNKFNESFEEMKIIIIDDITNCDDKLLNKQFLREMIINKDFILRSENIESNSYTIRSLNEYNGMNTIV